MFEREKKNRSVTVGGKAFYSRGEGARKKKRIQEMCMDALLARCFNGKIEAN